MNSLHVVASPRLASTYGRQPSSLRLRLALRCPDSFTKYFYRRKACTLLGKASVSNFTVPLSLSSSEKASAMACLLALSSELATPPHPLLIFVPLLSYSYHPLTWLAPYCSPPPR